MNAKVGVVTKDKFRTWEMQSLVREARRAGVDLIVLDPDACALDLASGAPLGADGTPVAVDVCLGRVDAGCLDAGARFLEALARRAPVLNDAHAFRTGRDKRAMSLALAEAGVPHPPTWLVPPRLLPALARQLPYPLVVKPPRGSEGMGVARVESARALLRLAIGAKAPLYLQSFCQGIVRELRVLVLDGQVLGAIARRPRKGEWRGNLALGAHAEAAPLDASLSRLALKAAAAVGADFAGVDLALTADGAWVLEVNVCPGFQGFVRTTGVDVAARLIDALLSRIGSKVKKEGAADERAAPHGQESLLAGS